MTAGDPDEQEKDGASVGCCGLTLAPMAAAETVSPPPAISEAEAHSIGVDAYLYFYPVVTM
jgi:hypothetical protein